MSEKHEVGKEEVLKKLRTLQAEHPEIAGELMQVEEEVKDLTRTMYDFRFELAALKGLAAMHGIPEEKFDYLMEKVGQLLTWSPPEDTPQEEMKFAVLRHVEDGIAQLIVEDPGGGDLRVVAPELLVLGAGMSSLLRKWHLEMHPEEARDPVFEVKEITAEELEELKKKMAAEGVQVGTVAEDLAEAKQAEEDADEGVPYDDGKSGWTKDALIDVT